MTKIIQNAFLVDDEKIDQRHYQRVMQRSGLIETITTFTYADEALEHLIAHPTLTVDVIFLDINMPRMDGFQFLEQANERLGPGFARIVVAMLTTSLDPADRVRAKSFDVVKDFINKPLTVEHIRAVAALFEGD